MECVTFYKSI